MTEETNLEDGFVSIPEVATLRDYHIGSVIVRNDFGFALHNAILTGAPAIHLADGTCVYRKATIT